MMLVGQRWAGGTNIRFGNVSTRTTRGKSVSPKHQAPNNKKSNLNINVHYFLFAEVKMIWQNFSAIVFLWERSRDAAIETGPGKGRGQMGEISCPFTPRPGREVGTSAPGGIKQPSEVLEISVSFHPITGFQKCKRIEICTKNNP